jgi:hypothetical protein
MGFGCDSAPLTARGLAPPGYVRQLEDPSLVGFAASASMAGDFLAYARGTAGGTRVFNHAAGATAYDLPQSGTTALQDDGKLFMASRASALGGGARCAIDLIWFSPAEPTAHQIPHKGCNADIAIAGDRLVFNRQTTGVSSELVSTNLQGGDVRVLARFAWASSLLSLDTDGPRVAWHALGCYTDTLHVAPLDAAPVPSPPELCKLAIRSKTIAVRKGRAEIPLSCPKGCNFVTGTFTFASDDRAFNSKRVRFKGPKGTLKVKLTKKQLARVKDGKAKKVPLSVGWLDATGRYRFAEAKVKLVAR